MLAAITTNANRVKAAGYWCEDADVQTDAFLSLAGVTWDTEIPIAAGIEGLGLANTLLALGAPHPRFKDRATQVLEKYIAELVILFSEQQGMNLPKVDIADTIHRLHDARYAGSRKQGFEVWALTKLKAQTPVESNLAECAMVIFSEEPLQLKAIHAGKALLTAMLIKEPKRDLYGELAAKLKTILENT